MMIPLVLLFFSSITGLVASQSSYTCSYSDPVAIYEDGNVWLEHYINYDEETFTMRVTFTDGDDRWVGIGINTNDSHGMVPAYAVIGDANRGVKRYYLGTDARDASGVWPLDDLNAHLKEASFVQEDGESILEFTLDLTILDEDDSSTIEHKVSPSSTWIWAVGLPNNQWSGKHRIHGSFSGLSLYDGCTIVTEDATTLSPTSSATSVGTANNLDTTSEAPQATSSPQNGNSDENGDDENSDVDTGVTLPSLGTDSSTSQISFNEESDVAATRGMWVTHGILMALAWGVFVPIAIGAAYLRKMKFLKQDALWLCVHFYGSLFAIIFTVFGFIIAVIATKLDNDLPHFQQDIHFKIGLTIFILLIVQGLAGYFRPSNKAPDSKEAPHDTTNGSKSSKSLDATENEQGMEVVDDDNHGHPKTIAVDRNNDDDDASSIPPPPPSPLRLNSKNNNNISWIRQYWEYFHRFLGITLLSLAWYNCTTGITLQSELYEQDDESKLKTIFWSITGTIAGLIFMVGYVIRPVE